MCLASCVLFKHPRPHCVHFIGLYLSCTPLTCKSRDHFVENTFAQMSHLYAAAAARTGDSECNLSRCTFKVDLLENIFPHCAHSTLFSFRLCDRKCSVNLLLCLNFRPQISQQYGFKSVAGFVVDETTWKLSRVGEIVALVVLGRSSSILEENKVK